MLKSHTRAKLGSLSGEKVLSRSMRQDRSFWEEGTVERSYGDSLVLESDVNEEFEVGGEVERVGMY